MDFNLLRKLKAKRQEIADREGKAVFMVLPNAALEAMAERFPKTRRDLEDIKGWGKKRIEKYGDVFLEIMQGADGQQPLLDVGLSASSEAASKKPAEKIPGREAAVLTVQQYLDVINIAVSRLGVVKVRGELSDISGSGMAFFDLKDSSGQDAVAKCYLGRWNLERYSHLLEPGLEVVVSGCPSIYKSGHFRIVVESIEPVGEGALRKAFEALKRKLEQKGCFDEARKRPIPQFIQNIAVVTSETGAVINDFRRNIGEYGFVINLLGVRVEGDFAENSIVSAIRWANKYCHDADIIVLIRGGGGLESMRAFNSEAVAEAILTSRLPVMTGIGHEKDETIAGYVSDLNLSTPTAVAHFIRRQREELMFMVESYVREAVRGVEGLVEQEDDHVRRIGAELESAFSLVLERYQNAIASHASELQHGLSRVFTGFRALEHAFMLRLGAYQAKVELYYSRVNTLFHQSVFGFERTCKAAQKQLAVAEAGLLPLNPEAVLARGYSVVYSASGRVLKSARDAKVGEKITARLNKGAIESRVENIED